MTTGGVVNIYENLIDSDCDLILNTKKIKQIQFADKFKVTEKTYDLINHRLLTDSSKPTLRLVLNGFGFVDNLDCTSPYLSFFNLRSSYTFFTPPPLEFPAWQALFFVFHSYVWIALVGSIIIVGMSIRLFDWTYSPWLLMTWLLFTLTGKGILTINPFWLLN